MVTLGDYQNRKIQFCISLWIPSTNSQIFPNQEGFYRTEMALSVLEGQYKYPLLSQTLHMCGGNKVEDVPHCRMYCFILWGIKRQIIIFYFPSLLLSDPFYKRWTFCCPMNLHLQLTKLFCTCPLRRNKLINHAIDNIWPIVVILSVFVLALQLALTEMQC